MLDTGTNGFLEVRRSQTAIKNPLSQTHQLGFPKRQVPPLNTPEYMAQSARAGAKDLSIFQHFTINNACNDEAERNFVPEQAPIDITQEECSQINSDLRRYLENGQRLGAEHLNHLSPRSGLNTLNEEKNTSFYVEANEGDWQKLEMTSPGETHRTGEGYVHGYHTVYAQPKPVMIKANLENDEW